MSFKQDIKKELLEFRTWTERVNMQAHLAKSELKAEARTAFREAEQSAAKLEARVEGLGESVDQALSEVLEQLRTSYKKVREALKD